MGAFAEPSVPVSAAAYPVINAQPSFFAVFKNLTLGDYAFFFGTTTFGAGYGFAYGSPLRRQSFFYMGGITAVVCFTASFRQSYLRLRGERPNPSECYYAGVEYPAK